MEWKLLVFDILGLICNVVWIILQPILCLYYGDRKRKCPPIKNPILILSATELARKIRNRELTSEQVIKNYIERVKEVNPVINAVIQDRFFEALEEARAVDRFLDCTEMPEEKFIKEKPLLGVPLTVKECVGLIGMKATLGSLNRLDEVAKDDGDSVLKLKKAGAIPILVSNTPEYSSSWDTSNYVTGRTCNPYDVRRSAGGSSGGEAALLASAASVIGVGSDYGGSIRNPSLFNGIFGLKPTRNVVSTKNHLPISESNSSENAMLCVGPMCRYAEDLSIMLKVMSGDIENKLRLEDSIALDELNVFFMESASDPWTQIPVQQEIKVAVRRAVAHLRDNCQAKIQENKFEGLSQGLYIMTPGLIVQDKNQLYAGFGIEDPQSFSLPAEILKLVLGKSCYTIQMLFMLCLISVTTFLLEDKLNEFKQLKEKVKSAMKKKLGSNGVFIYPNFPMSAYYPPGFIFGHRGLMYTQVFNEFGFPSTAVPMGFDKHGLPIGIQVIAAPFQDNLCIAVAKELSKIGGWSPPF